MSVNKVLKVAIFELQFGRALIYRGHWIEGVQVEERFVSFGEQSICPTPFKEVLVVRVATTLGRSGFHVVLRSEAAIIVLSGWLVCRFVEGVWAWVAETWDGYSYLLSYW